MSASDVISRLRELREAASANGWQVERCAVWCGSASCNMCWPGPGTWNVGSGYSPEDAAAIVAAMNSLESLLACAEALEVFARAARSIDVDSPGDHEPSHGRGSVTAGDLRKARAALQALAEGGE